jgi:5-formyltetrahydrofolate cyclo-ligase
VAHGSDEVKDPLAASAAEAAGLKADLAGKPWWRAWGRTTRAGLDVEALSARIEVGLRAWLDARPPTTVVAYRSMAGELTLDGLVDTDERHRWVTTRTPAGGAPLTVHPWHSPLERHRLGFVQPVAEAPVLDPAELGVVLAPGLVFDLAGGRLGYGMGYYDRLLSSAPQAVAVGITAEALVVPDLPTAAGDVPMAWLATETGMHRCPRPTTSA